MLAALLFLFFPSAKPASAAGAATCINAATTATTWTGWECVLEVADNGGLAGRNPYLMGLRVEYSAPGTWKRTG